MVHIVLDDDEAREYLMLISRAKSKSQIFVDRDNPVLVEIYNQIEFDLIEKAKGTTSDLSKP